MKDQGRSHAVTVLGHEVVKRRERHAAIAVSITSDTQSARLTSLIYLKKKIPIIYSGTIM